MQFSCHLSKFQNASVGGIHAEQFREYKNKNSYKNYVDDSKTHENVYEELTEDGRNWNKHVNQAKEDTARITGRKVRKDAVVICSVVETVPPSWDSEVCKEYFQSKADWYRQFLHDKAGIDEDKLLSMCVHLDESAPHATYVFVPEKDGKLQANNIVDKVFLKQLQSQSQQYCFDWIDSYNLAHEQKLEKMDPYVEGSTRKHLQEQEYKEQRLKDKIEQLEIRNTELEQKVLSTKHEHTAVKKKVASAKEELDHTKRQTEKVIQDSIAAQEIIDNAEKKNSVVEAREKAVEKREKKIAEYTGADSFASYNAVNEENRALKEEISWKDEIIEKLQEQNKKLQDTIRGWKQKIQKLGSRMTHALGFREEEYDDAGKVSEFPDSDVKEAYENAVGQILSIDAKHLRVLPDSEKTGCYALVSKKQDGKYHALESGFSSREEAEQRRRELVSAKRNLDESYKHEEKEELKM